MELTNDRITSLLKRETERKSDVEKKKEDKRKVLAEHERIDYFQSMFMEKHLQIENALNSSLCIRPEQLPAHFDSISKMISSLQKYVATSSIFLRCYDIKVCHESIQNLTIKAKELEEQLLPKKKFGFKNKTKPTRKDSSVTINGYSEDKVDFCNKTKFSMIESNCGFVDRSGENLILKKSDVLKKDVTLRNLENCIVKIYGNPSTVHMSYLKRCTVLCGPVSTSIFVENCTQCTLVIACQQLRLHSSVDIDVYLHVTSRAIIEDCKDVSVAPYNFEYDDIKQDFLSSGLDIYTNNWTSVDDFNWLNAEKQSPNWKILKEEEGITNWNKFLAGSLENG